MLTNALAASSRKPPSLLFPGAGRLELARWGARVCKGYPAQSRMSPYLASPEIMCDSILKVTLVEVTGWINIVTSKLKMGRKGLRKNRNVQKEAEQENTVARN
ncbi:hypothetical protein E2C01_006846 [Portunus trituberculatus]|uniref:Uncharacterized protein n=1 Tax=Portunus trituberculatus TaxID=210409 RepID=A0A5B7D2X2_PORTR|nr:hypothetical protein [Portunus trituberculatus]